MKPIPADVATLRAEAAGPSTAPPAAPEPEPSPDARMMLACKFAAKAIGGALCLRFNVPALDPEEVDGIGGALAQLVTVYDLGNMDPRTAAWLGMGMAVMGAAAPRIALVSSRAPKPQPMQDELTPETRGAGAPPPPPPAPEPGQDSQAKRDAASFANATA